MKRLTDPRKVTTSFNKDELVVVCVDARMFIGSPYSLDQHITDLSTLNALRTKSYPNTTIRLLMMLQEITHRPFLGFSGYVDDARAFETDTSYRNIVEQFVERVYSPDRSLLGFRFYFCTVNPKFHWDVAIGNLITENSNDDKMPPRAKLKGVDRFTRWIRSKDEWIIDIIGAWNTDGTLNGELMTKMLTHEFRNMGEASLPIAFSYQKAMVFFENALPGPRLVALEEIEGPKKAADAQSVSDDGSRSELTLDEDEEEDSMLGSMDGSQAEESMGGGTSATASSKKAPKKISLGPDLYVLDFRDLPLPQQNKENHSPNLPDVQEPEEEDGEEKQDEPPPSANPDEPEDIKVLYWISVLTRHTIGMYYTTLFSAEMDPEIKSMSFDKLYQSYCERINDKSSDSRVLSLRETVSGMIESLFEKYPNMSEMEKRLLPDVMMFFNSYAQSSELAPALRSCFNFIKQKQMESSVKGTKWSAMCYRMESDVKADGTKKDYYMRFNKNGTDFASNIVDFMYNLEHSTDVDYVHHEVLISYLASINALHIKNELQMHIIDNGPPSSSKSFIQQMTMRMLCPGTHMLLSNVTEKGFTSNMNLDGMNVFMDELADIVKDKGKSGTGDSIIKSMMMGVPIKTLMTSVDHDTHERLSIMTESKLRVRFHGGENSSKDSIAEPILDRCLLRDIPIWNRPGIELQEVKRQNKNKALIDAEEAFIDKCQTIHALAGILETMIQVKLVPQVDMSYANHLISRIKLNLSKKGVDMPKRKKQQVISLVRATTVFHAICMVFCTPTYFTLGDEFKMTDLFRCIPYLYATEEIVYFAVTSCSNSLVMSCTGPVCRAIKRKHERIIKHAENEKKKQEAKASKARAQASAVGGGTTNIEETVPEPEQDSRYYYIPLRMCEDNAILYVAGSMLYDELAIDGNVRFSREQVYTFVKENHNKLVEDPLSKEKVPILDVYRKMPLTKGVRFLKQFVEREGDNVNYDSILTAVKEVAFEGDGDFLIGTTYREYAWDIGNRYRDFMFPHIYRMERGVNSALQMAGINPNYVPRGLRKKFGSTYDEQKTSIHTQIECKKKEHFLKYKGQVYQGAIDYLYTNYPEELLEESYYEVNLTPQADATLEFNMEKDEAPPVVSSTSSLTTQEIIDRSLDG